MGNALLTIRDKRLYRQDFGTFEDYCQERWNFTRMRASQLISAAEVAQNIDVNLGLQIGEKHLRPLTALPSDIQPIAWQQAVASAPNGKVTAAHVQEVANHYKPHVAHNSGENEWYTPREYIEAHITMQLKIILNANPQNAPGRTEQYKPVCLDYCACYRAIAAFLWAWQETDATEQG